MIAPEYVNKDILKPANYRHSISLSKEKYIEKGEKTKKYQLTLLRPGAVNSPIIVLVSAFTML
jgi:hypothetical protein